MLTFDRLIRLSILLTLLWQGISFIHGLGEIGQELRMIRAVMESFGP